MTIRLGSRVPNFQQDSTEGKLDFYEFLGDSWGILFSHPADFTPVCTTELGVVAGLKGEWEKRNTKVVGLSVDPPDSHMDWAKDIEETQGHALNFPLVADADRSVSTAYDMLDGDGAIGLHHRPQQESAAVAHIPTINGQKLRGDPSSP